MEERRRLPSLPWVLLGVFSIWGMRGRRGMDSRDETLDPRARSMDERDTGAGSRWRVLPSPACFDRVRRCGELGPAARWAPDDSNP